jgi:phosphoserine phosphatase
VVGQPAAVNPDAALERLARAYHWPVLNLDRTP